MEPLRVLLTGAAGNIGAALMPVFADCFRLRTFDRQPLPASPDHVTGNLLDMDALRSAMKDIDVLVHLAAYPNEAPFVETLAPNNVVGLYNTFQTAQEAGVRRIVFASTVHTVGCYLWEGRVEVSDPVRPNTTYGATKVFGEALGRFYHEKHGIEFVAVRIGSFLTYGHELLKPGNLARRIWLSPRDAAKIFRLAVEKPGVGFAIVFGTSKTTHEHLSLATAREVLGYEPEDDVVKMYGADRPAT
jgi:uronate dehydrogenase